MKTVNRVWMATKLKQRNSWLWVSLLFVSYFQCTSCRAIDYDSFENNDFDDYNDEEEVDDDEFGFGDVYDFEDDANAPKLHHDVKQPPKKSKPQPMGHLVQDNFHKKVKPGLFSDEDEDFEDGAYHGKSKHVFEHGGHDDVKQMSYSQSKGPVDSRYPDTYRDYSHHNRPEPIKKSPFGSRDGGEVFVRGKVSPNRGRKESSDYYDSGAHGGSKFNHDANRKILGNVPKHPIPSERGFDEGTRYKTSNIYDDEDNDEDYPLPENYQEAKRESDGLHFFSSHRNEI